jgi:hypothetical protein
MNAIIRSGRATHALGLIALVASLGVSASRPVHAEDSGFWETVRASAGFRAAPRSSSWFPRLGYERRGLAHRRAARAKQPAVKVADPVPPSARKPPDPAKRPNPLVTLLNDPTLRPGDIVMFPDGPRVFRGRPGAQHAYVDFVKVSASKELPKSTRKALAAMSVGENNAWSSALTSQVAQSAVDVESTGALPRKARSRR